MLHTYYKFQPTRPLRGATMIRGFPPGNYIISTHAPLAGRDGMTALQKWLKEEFQPTRPLRGATLDRDFLAADCRISTHAPLAGRDLAALVGEIKGKKFQPTRPLRGATGYTTMWCSIRLDFNPRAPCGARHHRI